MKCFCPECKKEFATGQALDHSFLAPLRDFGCPHCRTFFENNPNKNPWWGWPVPFAFIFGINSISRAYNSEEPVALAPGIVALAIGFILLLIGRRKFQHDVKNLRKISLDRT